MPQSDTKFKLFLGKDFELSHVPFKEFHSEIKAVVDRKKTIAVSSGKEQPRSAYSPVFIPGPQFFAGPQSLIVLSHSE